MSSHKCKIDNDIEFTTILDELLSNTSLANIIWLQMVLLTVLTVLQS